ncbi:hypothetical protein KKD62_02745 [Patescibacteria group bacterium]|nr:hypothetical protein [Patescibacteria group bacterium]MBU1931858.1 hypothetical protein [Patescibacteria group bacterium]
MMYTELVYTATVHPGFEASQDLGLLHVDTPIVLDLTQRIQAASSGLNETGETFPVQSYLPVRKIPQEINVLAGLTRELNVAPPQTLEAPTFVINQVLWKGSGDQSVKKRRSYGGRPVERRIDATDYYYGTEIPGLFFVIGLVIGPIPKSIHLRLKGFGG